MAWTGSAPRRCMSPGTQTGTPSRLSSGNLLAWLRHRSPPWVRCRKPWRPLHSGLAPGDPVRYQSGFRHRSQRTGHLSERHAGAPGVRLPPRHMGHWGRATGRNGAPRSCHRRSLHAPQARRPPECLPDPSRRAATPARAAPVRRRGRGHSSAPPPDNFGPSRTRAGRSTKKDPAGAGPGGLPTKEGSEAIRDPDR